MKTLITLCLLLVAYSVTGQGILFSEYRMIMQGNHIRTLQVCNPTGEVRTYQLSVINKRMDENGTMHDLADPVNTSWTLRPWLRVFPRRITLEPGGCQEVQLQVKMPDSGADGEYRTYLHFLPLLKTGQAPTVQGGQSSMQMDIVFRVGSAIPVIYRKNTTKPKLTIDSVRLVKQGEAPHLLEFRLNREGNQSVYGKILIEGQVKGKPYTLVSQTGRALYNEMAGRKFIFPVKLENIDTEPDGKIKLHVSYIDSENPGAREPEVLMKKECILTL